jgi:fumarate reductase subunit C
VQCFELIPTDTFFQFVPLVVSILVEVIHVDEDMVCITFGKANYLVNILILFCIRCFVFAEKVFKCFTY